MINLTVIVNLLNQSHDFSLAFLIVFVILPVSMIISLLTSNGTDEQSENISMTAGIIAGLCFFLGLPMIAAGGKEESPENIKKYQVVKKSLLIDKVTNAKLHVKQISNHKFILQQDKRKFLSAEVYEKKVDVTPTNGEGKAYLEVANYVKKQQKKNKTIANIRIIPSLSSTSGFYETPKGKFKVVCYTDQKEQHRTNNAIKVLKY